MNSYIFREYDIRGIVNKDLNEKTVTEIGKAFASIIKRKGGKIISVGGDIRLSTEEFRSYLINGITSAGVDVLNVGPCPTGAQYFSHYYCKVDGGIMITGSHNPPDYNGFKMTMFKQSVFGAAVQEIRQTIENEDFTSGKGQVIDQFILDAYIKDVRSKIHVKNRIKVVMDDGNGAAALCSKAIFDGIDNLEVIHLFDSPDGMFPNHHPDPTVERNLVQLKAEVAKHQADFGIGYDGDADRIGVIDSKGQIIWGDKLLIIYAKEALKKKKQEIIFDVKCSQALEEEIIKAGGTPVMSATGHSLLKNKMKERQAKIAGEMSGHMFFGDENYGYDDAIYAAARLISIVSQSDQKIESFLDGVTPYIATPEIRLECESDEIKFEITKKAIEFFSSNYKCNLIDGVRIMFDDGWGLVRQSNTQPVIVTRMEAKTEKRLSEIKNLIINKLAEFGNLKEGEH